jgi:hypothetical protein
MYLSFNYVTELEKLSRGERTKITHAELAEFAVKAIESNAYVPRKPRRKKHATRGRNGVAFLEALFALEDPRG